MKSLIAYDAENPKSKDVLQMLKIMEVPDDLIISIGGDGFMLETIHKYYDLNFPFYGINVGHKGHLMNNIRNPEDIFKNLILQELFLLEVEVTTLTGETQKMIGFNDSWVKSQGGQAAWIKVTVEGKVRINNLVCDGVLLATPAGSTGYARSMGASPVPLDSNVLVLVGSNVSRPNFKSCNISSKNNVVFENVGDLNKRPLEAFVDGVSLGLVTQMKITKSELPVRLLFKKGNCLEERRLKIQFPKQ